MTRLLLSSALALTFSVGLVACYKDKAADEATAVSEVSMPLPADQIMVAAADHRAVKAGLDVLAEGGTAVDAAIAVQSVLGLVEPQSSGIAGGAFMIFYNAEDKSVTFYDGRETAPMAADKMLFTDESGTRLPYGQGIVSGKSTGVPGAVAMLHLAHSDHGQLPWSRGFDRAIELAEDGWELSPRLNSSLARAAGWGFLNQDEFARGYFFQEDGKTPKAAGTLMLNPEYGQTLRAIAADYRALYEGDIPAQIIAATQKEPRPGVLTMEDFASYAPDKEEALCTEYKAYKICGALPPSSGGVATQYIMSLLEPMPLADEAQTAQGWHYFIEASRLGYADRDFYVADDNFVDVPIAGMLDKDYLSTRRDMISADSAMEKAVHGTPPGAPSWATDATPDSPGTTHFSIRDGYGNVVSMTTTVEAGFGSQRMAAGMILNNQLTDFSFVAVDADGRPVANRVEAGKRPRSSMSPTIVLRGDDDFYFATGSPGGNSIIAYTAKTMVGMLEWGLTPQEAAALPNVIARGDTVRIEEPLMDAAVIADLRERGHDIQLSDGEASGIHIVMVSDDGSVLGGADPRREGIAMSLADYQAEKAN